MLYKYTKMRCPDADTIRSHMISRYLGSSRAIAENDKAADMSISQMVKDIRKEIKHCFGFERKKATIFIRQERTPCAIKLAYTEKRYL